jgi:hypothetical protein
MSARRNGMKIGTIAWMKLQLETSSDECITWPFSRDSANGRGRVGYKGVSWWTHRLMCVFAHGEAPTPAHEAAHTCGKGHEGCVNPRHLEWKTASENHKDRRSHGTAVTNKWGPRGKITKEQAGKIRDLRGTLTQVQIGKLFDIPFQTVSRIQLDDPNRVLKFQPFNLDEDAYLMTIAGRHGEIPTAAKHLGRTVSSIYGRMKQLRRKGLVPSAGRSKRT